MDGQFPLSIQQKQDIEYLFKNYVTPPKCFNQTNNIILNEVFQSQDYISYIKVRNLFQKIGYFYEHLFAYLCNLRKPIKQLCSTCKIQRSNKLRKLCETCNRNSFDLINEEEHVYIELKSSFQTDNHNSKDSKFHHLGEFKSLHPEAQVYYICLNDNRAVGSTNYTHRLGFEIITGIEAWQFFCKRANIDKGELIEILRELLFNEQT